MFYLQPRAKLSTTWVYLSPLLAIFLTLIAGLLLFSLIGDNPVLALHTFFIKPISDSFGITELLVKSAPILLCAYGLAICYKASVWNIGAEGQLLMGGLIASSIALAFNETDSTMALPLTLLSGMLGGMVWASIASVLKYRFHTNEILTTIMLNYIALNILLWAVYGPLKDPDGYSFPESALFGNATILPVILDGTRLHLGILFAPVIMAISWILLSKSFFGFQVQVTGLNPAAAKMAGFNDRKIGYIVLALSGALAGLAGAIEVTGPIGQLVPRISPGYGYAAIIVAFLGRLHPVGITLAGLLMGLIYLGGELVQIDLGMPKAVTGVFQGLLLFFLLASDVLIRFRICRTKGGLIKPVKTQRVY